MGSVQRVSVIRAMTRSHLAGAIEVINSDALPGQPWCTTGMLLQATKVRDAGGVLRPATPVERPRSFVAIGDRLVGAADVTRTADGVGSIKWLHAREDPTVIGELLDHALDRLAGCDVIEAFAGGGIGPIVSGLPAVRSTTQEALVARGFAATPAGRYLYRPMSFAPPALADPPRIEVTAHARRHQLTIPGLAEATVSVLAPGHGLLQWIEVDSSHRGGGLGAHLLNACLRYLHRLGVRHVIGFLDDHNLSADDGHGRIGAHMICTRAGFVTGAQLATYSKVRVGEWGSH
ncbi:GNAT family N-acetyltransferase [Kribbella sp. NPDC056861]|uniref:GNAT family N-acetyltransferase n=1 Tax=Kribbella sp. NPDC056861 TaxID=3154857 RepID=UPI0034444D69